MNARRAGLLLLVIQLFLVLTIAAKYLYERKVCPRVWVRATQYDPQTPLRGRYLAVQPLVNACDLSRDAAQVEQGYLIAGEKTPDVFRWDVTLEARNGVLVPQIHDHHHDANQVLSLRLRKDAPCERAAVQTELLYFIPEHARSPFPLKPGQEFWVKVTVPPSGPPRPIQLAISDSTGFQPLKFE